MLNDEGKGFFRLMKAYVKFRTQDLNKAQLAFLDAAYFNAATDLGLARKRHRVTSYPGLFRQLHVLRFQAWKEYGEDPYLNKMMPIVTIYMKKLRYENHRELDIDKFRGRLSEKLSRLLL